MATKQVKVWDPLIRIFHWSLVLAFAAAYLTGEEWDEWEEVHEFGGYAALGLILFRIVWGFIGSKHARFSDFLYGPKTVVEYLKSLLTTHPKHYLGHNPAGGWMIILLMAGILTTGFSGLKLLAIEEGEGPFANLEAPALISNAQADDDRDEAHERRESEEAMGVPVLQPGQEMSAAQPAQDMQPVTQPPVQEMQMTQPVAQQPMQSARHEDDEEHEGMEGEEEEGEEFWEEIHEVSANLTLFLVILHVLGVIVSSRLHGENLARAMVTGKKNSV